MSAVAEYPAMHIPAGALFIGGTWRAASEGETRPVISPSDGQAYAEIAWATEADVEAAVRAARSSFEGGVWSELSGRERSRVLLRIAALVRERSDELAWLESRDTGKTISFARRFDVALLAEHYEYVASLAQHLDGAVREVPAQLHAFTRLEPLGVVAAISPFNFPLMLANTKIALALAAGNSVVHKPATETPMTALAMAQLFQDAGVPDGVVNVVTGSGRTIGDSLTSHPDVDKVGFTGSTGVGAHIAARAGEHLKQMTAELGGNAANIVFDDADLDQAAKTSVDAFLFNTGQFCMAGPRLLVHASVRDEFLDRMARILRDVVIAHPADPSAQLGPLTSQGQYDKVSGIISDAVEQGGRIFAQTPLPESLQDSGGFYLAPTVLVDLPADSPAVVEETFGPVVTVQTFTTEDEAVELANNSTPYGLASGLQTGSIPRAFRVAKRLNAGITWVNTWAQLDPAVPFGGVKASGWGREFGPEALEAYSHIKSVIIGLE